MGTLVNEFLLWFPLDSNPKELLSKAEPLRYALVTCMVNTTQLLAQCFNWIARSIGKLRVNC